MRFEAGLGDEGVDEGVEELAVVVAEFGEAAEAVAEERKVSTRRTRASAEGVMRPFSWRLIWAAPAGPPRRRPPGGPVLPAPPPGSHDTPKIGVENPVSRLATSANRTRPRYGPSHRASFRRRHPTSRRAVTSACET